MLIRDGKKVIICGRNYKMNKKQIYLDNAATTPLLPEVKEKIINCLQDFENPSSLYQSGFNNKELINFERHLVADVLKCDPGEVVFTSGSSESNSTALISGFLSNRIRGSHIITSKGEHSSILKTCHILEKYYGARISYIDINKYGCNLSDIEDALCSDTILVSIMSANNELGYINNIGKIADIIKKKNQDILFHVDATQSFAKNIIDISKVDLLSASAHKIGGLKGSGLLYVKNGVNIPMYIAGSQEKNRRGGTENFVGISSFGEASYQWIKNGYNWNNHIKDLRDYLINRVINEISYCDLNSPISLNTLPSIANIRFDGIRGEELLVMLDMYGICVSTGSACNSAVNEPSHVLKAIGLTDEEANSSIRFSIGHENTINEIDYAVDKLKECVERLRGTRIL